CNLFLLASCSEKYPAGAEMGTTSLESIARKRLQGAWWKAVALAHVIGGLTLLRLGGLALAQQPWHQLQQHVATRNWPTTKANVLAVSLHEVRHTNAVGAQGATGLLLGVAYEYEVDGQVFEGTRASFSDLGDT